MRKYTHQMTKIIKPLFLFFIFFFCTNVVFAHNPTVNNTVVGNGIGLGTAIAVAISWSRNKSILWAIIHGVLSWFYVIFYFFTRNND